MNTDIIISQFDVNTISKRFPNFELSYETISHKKVYPNYNLVFAIPVGKKYYAWFSFYKNEHVLFILELNKDKKIVKTSIVSSLFDPCLCLGTILYGTILPNTDVFIIEDIYSYQGILLKKMGVGEKLFYIHELFDRKFIQHERESNSSNLNANPTLIFALASLWWKQDDVSINADIPKDIHIPYPIHHSQFRNVHEISAFINLQFTRKIGEKNKFQELEPNIHIPTSQEKTSYENSNFERYHAHYMNPQYKYPTIFKVQADIQFDIYHLFAYGKNKSSVYYNIAYIPNYKTSVFMNSIFRNIKENANLDSIEESDDESDFEDIRQDKYVDLRKHVFIECIFNMKFKKWTPVRLVESPCKVVHISQL
jgi:hypothetical protein